jgi:hypothetical protein
MIVRQRYDETFGLLAVASVTANVSVSASAGTNFRVWGSASDAEGNLVPLSAGVAYEENPTISYVPLTGEKHMGRMLEKMTLNEILAIAEVTTEKDLWLRESIASINGVVNPRAYGEPPSPRFDRFVDLYMSLHRAHVAALGRAVATDGSTEAHFISIHDYDADRTDEVRAFLDALGIEDAAVDGRDILLPVRWSFGSRTSDAIDVETRSAFDVIRSAGSMIEVPVPHLEAGIVDPRPWQERERDRFLTIRSSETRPKNATVAVRFRDWWFYIDATDARSKRSFSLIRILITFTLEDKGAPQSPIITIPTK